MPIDDIESPDDIPKHPVIVIYGAQGCGKTILATSLGNNNLLVTNERSSVSISNFPELKDRTKVLRYTSYGRVTKLISQIHSGEVETDHVIIDTFPGLVDIKLGEQLKKVDFNRKHADINSLEDYQLLKEHLKPFIRSLVRLDVSVTFICHDRVPDSESYAKGDRLTRPNVPFRLFELLNGYTNITGYMYKSNGKDGESRRVIRTETSREFVAKTHIPMDSVVTDTKFVETIRNWKGI